jgi:hypothetical protein
MSVQLFQPTDRADATAEAGATDQAQTSAMSWLESLRDAHAELLRAIAELERLTQGPTPSKKLLVDTRWNVSKASLHRRQLWGRVLAFLSHSGGSGLWVELRQLQEIDGQLLRASSDHIGKWTADAAIDDWEGYCRASKIMRGRMLHAIATEKSVLYGMLGHSAGQVVR